MRVLYLTEEAISFSEPLVRGGAIHVRRVVENLRKRGHDVHLVDWNDRAERTFQTSVTPRTRFVDGPTQTFLRAVSIARKRDVDVVVSKSRKTYVAGLAAARVVGVPHVVHVGSMPTTVGDGVVARLDAASFSARLRLPHDGYLVVCDAIGGELHERGIPNGRVYHIGNAVDVDQFNPDNASERPAALQDAVERAGDDFLVGYVGGLHWYKGLSDLAAALERTDAEVTAILAGDGPARTSLETEFGEDGVFLGSVPYDSVQSVYQAVDALVLPSYTEGLPRVIFEAQAMATPVVVTRVGGVPEVVEDGETGLLCDPRAPGQLAAKIDRLATDQELCGRIGRRARKSVERSYSWERLYDRYERYLGAIVDS